MLTVIKAPTKISKHELNAFTIFLAGSIDQGNAVDWQLALSNKLVNYDAILFNPRRQEWNAKLKQSIDEPSFLEQVTWEQHYLHSADFRIFYFTKDSKAPITFMELGQTITKPGIICCEEGFYRTGNLEITAKLNGMPIVSNMDDLLKHLKVLISAKQW